MSPKTFLFTNSYFHDIDDNDDDDTPALYSALSQSIADLQRVQLPGNSSISSACSWIIALTDGEDNSSGSVKANHVVQQLQQTDIGLIIIGVGADVKPEVSAANLICVLRTYMHAYTCMCALQRVHLHILQSIHMHNIVCIQCLNA